MTPEQKSRQAAANSNAKRIVWQREAMRCKAALSERQAWIDSIGAENTRLTVELRKRSDELGETREALADVDKMLRMADARAEEWRRRYIQMVELDVYHQAREQAAKDEPMPY